MVFWCNVSVGKSLNEEKCEKNPDDPFCKAEREKAFEAKKSLNDSNIYTLLFKFIEKDGHPKIDDHKVMAETLIQFIDENRLWE